MRPPFSWPTPALRGAAAVSAVALLAACSDAGLTGAGGGTPVEVRFDTAATLAPTLPPATPPVPTLVMLADGPEPVLAVARAVLDSQVPEIGARRDSVTPLLASRGFVVPLSAAELAEVASDPRVEYGEAPRPVQADRLPARLGPAGVGAFGQSGAILGVAAAAPWALDRITQRLLPLDGAATFTGTGAGVTIYVIDTGILETHAEFGGRVVDGPDFILGGTVSGDCGGHGTKVASDAAGATMGTARQAKIVSVRVLDCNGSGSSVGIVQAIDWVIAQVQAHPGPAVINMSVGVSGVCVPVNQAAAKATQAGIVVVASAGNSNVSACGFSPAGEPSAITVGATDVADNRAGFSNWGSCVDLWAPGVSVLGADHAGTTASGDWSGTSASSPFVAGVAALYLQQYRTATPAQVAAALAAGATVGVVKGANVTNNRLVYLPGSGSIAPMPGAGSSGPGTFVAPPVPAATITCARRACTFDGRASTDAEGVTKWAWTFGDAAKATGATAVHRFVRDGRYAATLTVTNLRGVTAVRTDSVVVADQPPTPGASVTCTGWTCRFDGSRSIDDGTIVRYTWSFGDGASGSATTTGASHTFRAAGTYTGALTVVDDAGQATRVPVTATTTARPPVAATKVMCVGRTCTFDASTSRDDVSIAGYTWDFLDGTLQTGVRVTKAYASAGTWRFKLTVRNVSGLTSTVQGQFVLR